MNFFIKRLRDRIGNIEKNISDLSLSGDGHIKGTIVELEISNLIKEFIPENYGVASGWIFNSAGERSEERDIIIYDKNKAPQFMINSSIGIIPKISTVYDIQIKTTLNEKNLVREIEKFSGNCTAPRRVIISHGFSSLKSAINIMHNNDKNFLTGPAVSVFAVGGSGYFFFYAEKKKIREIISKETIINNAFNSKNVFINGKIEIKKDILINGLSLDSVLDKEIIFYSWETFEWATSFYEVFYNFIVGMLNNFYQSGLSAYFSPDGRVSTTLSKVVLFEGNTLYSSHDFENGIGKMTLTFSLSFDESSKYSLSCQKKE